MHDRGGLRREAEGAMCNGYVLPRKSWGTNGVGRRVEVGKRDGEQGLGASIDAG